MKYLRSFYLPLLLSMPLQSYKAFNLSSFNESGCSESSILTGDEQVCYLDTSDLFKVILVNVQKEKNTTALDLDTYEEAQLTSGLNLFPKIGTTYSEKTEPRRGSSSSKKKSTLVFRQEQSSRRGEASSSSGRSRATHPENVANFEKANIPIDPKKNPLRRPDNIQNWRWDKQRQCWKVVGERRIKMSNGKIITEKEWQRMLINNSRQA